MFIPSTADLRIVHWPLKESNFVSAIFLAAPSAPYIAVVNLS